MSFPDKELEHLWSEFEGDPLRLGKIASHFKWTVPQAYIATEHLAKRDAKNAGSIYGN